MSGSAPMSGLRPAQGNRGDGWASNLSSHPAQGAGNWLIWSCSFRYKEV